MYLKSGEVNRTVNAKIRIINGVNIFHGKVQSNNFRPENWKIQSY